MLPPRNRSILTFGAQVLLNALTGLLFARVLATAFGATAAKDAFDVAYAFPFMLIRMSGFSILHSLSASYFARLRVAGSPEEAGSFLAAVLFAVASVSAISVAVLSLCSDQLAVILAPGLSPRMHPSLSGLLLILTPLAGCFCISTLLGGVLFAYGIAVTGELPQIVSRVVTMGVMAVLPFQPSILLVALLLLAGSIAAIVLQLFALQRFAGVTLRIPAVFPARKALAFFHCMPHAGALMVTTQIAHLIMQRAASECGPGSVAILLYGIGVASPIALLASKPLSMALVPHLAIHLGAADNRAALRLAFHHMIAVCAITIPLSSVCSYFATHCVRFLYGGGVFDESAIFHTASLLRLAAWTVCPSALITLLIPVLLIRSPTRNTTLLAIGPLTHIAVTLFGMPGEPSLSWLVMAQLVGLIAQAMLAVLATVLTLWPGDCELTTSKRDLLTPPTAVRAA